MHACTHRLTLTGESRSAYIYKYISHIYRSAYICISHICHRMTRPARSRSACSHTPAAPRTTARWRPRCLTLRCLAALARIHLQPPALAASLAPPAPAPEEAAAATSATAVCVCACVYVYIYIYIYIYIHTHTYIYTSMYIYNSAGATSATAVSPPEEASGAAVLL